MRTELLFISFLLFLSCNKIVESGNPSNDELYRIVEELGNTFRKGVQEGDSALIVSMYTDSAQYVQPGRRISVGRDEVAKDWEGFFNWTAFDLVLETLEVRGSGDVIYETGSGTTFFLDSNNDTATFRFNYVNIWLRQSDGSYKLDVDCYTPVE